MASMRSCSGLASGEVVEATGFGVPHSWRLDALAAAVHFFARRTGEIAVVTPSARSRKCTKQ